MDPWDHANLVRIEFSSNLPQKLCQITEYCPGDEPKTFGKHGFQHFFQKLSFYYGFLRTCLAQNVHVDPGIISRFHRNRDFDTRFTR